MLKYRLIFGPVMALALVILLYLDERLDAINLSNTFVGSLFQRAYLPRGLLTMVFVWGLIWLGSYEICRIFWAKRVPTKPWILAVAGIIGCTLIYAMPFHLDSQMTMAIFATLMIAVFLGTLVAYSYIGKTKGAVLFAAATMFAMIYIGLLPGFYLAIRRWHSAWIVAAVMLITKSCDIGAYFSGRAFGKHKLIEWLSPKKTWEGLIGGILFSGLVAMGFAALFNYLQVTQEGVHLAGWWEPPINGEPHFHVQPFPLGAVFIAGVLFGLIGQFGDLTASLFKRDAGIKDSGNSIPGFGGVLDVVDSPIIVAPFAYWALTILRMS